MSTFSTPAPNLWGARGRESLPRAALVLGGGESSQFKPTGKNTLSIDVYAFLLNW